MPSLFTLSLINKARLDTWGFILVQKTSTSTSCLNYKAQTCECLNETNGFHPQAAEQISLKTLNMLLRS